MNLFFKTVLLVMNLSAAAAICGSDESNIFSVAKRDSQGRAPDGRCYSHVADYIDQTGYGGINPGGFDDAIPPAYWAEAHDFADYLNQGNNAANLCLVNNQRKYGNNPYNAPKGAIVVVRAGTPGTANPTAGDIAIASGGDVLYNGGEMGYGGSGNFPPGNNYVLGIFEPTSCVGHCGGGGSDDDTPIHSDDDSGHCPGECSTCVKNAGGKACADRCQGCSSACLDCINGGGGTACAARCAPTILYSSTI